MSALQRTRSCKREEEQKEKSLTGRSYTALVLTVGLIVAVLLYFSPDESNWNRDHPEQAISLGRTFAFHLLNGFKQGLLRLSDEPARTRIASSSFRSLDSREMQRQLAGKDIPTRLTTPIFAQRDDDMELVKFERLESFMVMTFVFKDFTGSIVEIPGKGMLLYSVAVRYYHPVDDRPLSKLLRKTSNLPLVRNLAGPLGTTGRWIVFDYHYEHDLANYFEWVSKEGEAHGKRLRREGERAADRPEELIASAERGLEFLYKWGSTETKQEIERIRRFYAALSREQGTR